MSILLGLVIGSFYGNQIDEVADDIKNIATIDIEHLTKDEKKEKTITFEEKTRALEIGYVDNTNNNLYLEEPKKDTNTKNTFHFEEPNLEEIDKKEEEVVKEIIPILPKIIIEPKKEKIKED